METLESRRFLMLMLILFIGWVLGCATGGKYGNVAETPSQTPAYTALTKKSTYYDVVRVMGKPDVEVTAGPPEATLPNTMMAYKSCRCVIFLIYKQFPKKGKFDKSKTMYIGAKGVAPEKVLHVSNEEYRILINSYPLRGID